MSTPLEDKLADALRELARVSGHEQPGVNDPFYQTRGPLAEKIRAALREYDEQRKEQQ